MRFLPSNFQFLCYALSLPERGVGDGGKTQVRGFKKEHKKRWRGGEGRGIEEGGRFKGMEKRR